MITPPPISSCRNSVGCEIKGIHFLAQLVVVLEYAHDLVPGQLHELGDRGTVECRVSMERPLGVGGEVVVVGAGLVQRSDPFGLRRSVQTYAIEILLGGIVRGRVVVEPTSCFVDRSHVR